MCFGGGETYGGNGACGSVAIGSRRPPLPAPSVSQQHPPRPQTNPATQIPQGPHRVDVTITLAAESAVITGAGALPFTPLMVTRRIPFELVAPADAPDPIGPPEGLAVAGGDSDPADSVAMKYYCAVNFNVGGKIFSNWTVDRVAEDGPLSPGAFRCARECNRAGEACAAFGVVAGTNCYLMRSVGLV